MLRARRTIFCAAIIAWGVCVTATLASPVMLSTPTGGRGGPPSWVMVTSSRHVGADAISRAVGSDDSGAVSQQQSSVESSTAPPSAVMTDPTAAASSTTNAPALIPLPAAASTGALVLGGLAFARVCRTLRRQWRTGF